MTMSNNRWQPTCENNPLPTFVLLLLLFHPYRSPLESNCRIKWEKKSNLATIIIIIITIIGSNDDGLEIEKKDV